MIPFREVAVAVMGLGWGLYQGPKKLFINPWGLLACAGILRVLTAGSLIEAAGGCLVLALVQWNLEGPRYRPSAALTLAALLLVALVLNLTRIPAAYAGLLSPLVLLALGKKGEDGVEDPSAPALPGLAAMILALAREGPLALPLLPLLAFLSLVGLARGVSGLGLGLGAWFASLAVVIPFPASALAIPLVGLLPWLGKGGGLSSLPGRALMSAAWALPLIMWPGTDLWFLLLWLSAGFWLFRPPAGATKSLRPWVAAGGGLGLGLAGGFILPRVFPGLPVLPGSRESWALSGDPEAVPIPALLVLSPFLGIGLGALAEAVLGLARHRSPKAGLAGPWAGSLGLGLGALGAFLLMSGMGLSFGGLFLGAEGGGPQVLSLDSLGAGLAGIALVHELLSGAAKADHELLIRGSAILLLLFSPDLGTGLLALALLGRTGRQDTEAPPSRNCSGLPLAALGVCLLARRWGSLGLPDFGEFHPADAAHPLGRVGFALLAAGAMAEAGFSLKAGLGASGIAVLAWLLRLGTRVPGEAGPVLATLGLAVVVFLIVGVLGRAPSGRSLGSLASLACGMAFLAGVLAFGLPAPGLSWLSLVLFGLGLGLKAMEPAANSACLLWPERARIGALLAAVLLVLFFPAQFLRSLAGAAVLLAGPG